MNTPLTTTQANVLEAASNRANGNIEPLPDTLRGGARTKVIDCLITKGLAATTGELVHITDAGYAAIGKSVPLKGVQNVDTPCAQESLATSAMRAGTKLARVVECLLKPGGATVAQMTLETGWQAHSIRGAISGTIKRKFGFQVQTDKPNGGERTYRIA